MMALPCIRTPSFRCRRCEGECVVREVRLTPECWAKAQKQFPKPGDGSRPTYDDFR